MTLQLEILRGCQSFGGDSRGRNMHNCYKFRENGKMKKTRVDHATIESPPGLCRKLARSNKMHVRKQRWEFFSGNISLIPVYGHAFY